MGIFCTILIMSVPPTNCIICGSALGSLSAGAGTRDTCQLCHNERVIQTLLGISSTLAEKLENGKQKVEHVERKVELSKPAWTDLTEIKNFQEAPDDVRDITYVYPLPLAHSDGVTWFAAHRRYVQACSPDIHNLLSAHPLFNKLHVNREGSFVGRLNCILVVDKKAPAEGRYRILKNANW